ncbi:MAG TPA: DUF2179 domain-containing protein [Thermoanaerobaculia bacterium]|nr:DUF2179 domain-containing protein [Thermoanaerobaculia bacterium]HUM31281.1 DUF2179 domain-containing protein [Thermoanaerobaculia bacterium]HXK69648.1 DUF2179 domain-containing protein [Thermoanaerobaculia bacterium]
MTFDLYTWVIIPVLIFFARVLDVSVGTMRIIFLARGGKWIAPVLGFFEVLIWLLAIRQVMENLNNPLCYLGYAGGFATGNFVGMLLEERLAMGTLMVRTVTQADARALIDALNVENYGVTAVDAQGAMGPVSVIFTVIKRKNLGRVLELIQTHNPRAFYTVEDTRSVGEGVFPSRERAAKPAAFLSVLRRWRKGK